MIDLRTHFKFLAAYIGQFDGHGNKAGDWDGLGPPRQIDIRGGGEASGLGRQRYPGFAAASSGAGRTPPPPPAPAPCDRKARASRAARSRTSEEVTLGWGTKPQRDVEQDWSRRASSRVRRAAHRLHHSRHPTVRSATSRWNIRTIMSYQGGHGSTTASRSTAWSRCRRAGWRRFLPCCCRDRDADRRFADRPGQFPSRPGDRLAITSSAGTARASRSTATTWPRPMRAARGSARRDRVPIPTTVAASSGPRRARSARSVGGPARNSGRAICGRTKRVRGSPREAVEGRRSCSRFGRRHARGQPQRSDEARPGWRGRCRRYRRRCRDRRGADERQSQRHVDGVIEGNRLDRDQRLVMDMQIAQSYAPRAAS